MIFFASAIIEKADLNIVKLSEKLKEQKEKNSKLKKEEKKDNSELGLFFAIEIFKNLHKCKEEFNAWLADLLEIKKEEVLKIPLKEYAGLVKQMQSIEGLTELFK